MKITNIKKKLFENISRRYPVLNGNSSYSQEGEDKILQVLFEIANKTTGFFVDVGAHHPVRFSNTYLFYLRGWRGINIDASKEAISLFQKERPNDINVFMGVDNKKCELTYYIFNEPALNTFDPAVVKKLANHPNYKVVEERPVQVMPLGHILDMYLPDGQSIDFLSVDVEGLDLAALRSNDWSKYKPSYILVEFHSGYDHKDGASFDEVMNSEVVAYLGTNGYEPFAKTVRTVFFRLKT